MNLQHTAPDDVVARLRRSDRRRLGRACAGLAVAVLVLALLRVVWGTYQVTVPDLVRILGGETIPGASFIVLEEKLPRAVAAVLTGAALGAAGALYRRTLRNPLASPDILGVTQGAAAAVVLGMLATAGQTGGGSDLMRAATALIGGLAAVVAVFATARSVGGERFVVAGIAVAAAGQAVVAGAMLSLAQHDLQSATVWIAGSLNGVTWGRIALLAGVLVVALPLAGVLHARLAPADVGPDLAHALGHGGVVGRQAHDLGRRGDRVVLGDGALADTGRAQHGGQPHRGLPAAGASAGAAQRRPPGRRRSPGRGCRSGGRGRGT